MRRLAAVALALALFAAGAFVAPIDAGQRPGPSAYEVEGGDSWYGIAAKLGLNPTYLMVANGATPATPLHPGRIVFYYPQTTVPTTTTTTGVQPSTTTTSPPAPSTTAAPASTTTAPTTSTSSSTSTTSTTPPTTVAAARSFSEGFDVSPTAPQVWNPSNWMILSHWRDKENWVDGRQMSAHHSGVNCGEVNAAGSDPGTLHALDERAEGRYLCKNHLMTAIDGQEYGLIYITPPALLDFSAGPGKLSWDVSTLTTSLRDWVDIYVTPYNSQVAAPFDHDLDVDFQGEPRNGLHLTTLNAGNGETSGWRVEWIVNDNVTVLGSVPLPVAQSAAVRSPMEMTISSTLVSFGFTGQNVTSFKLPAAATWSKGVVQFGHHSYNPRKDCPGRGSGSQCAPDSWHWDNIRIAPSAPFTILRGVPEVVVAGSGFQVAATVAQTVTWVGAAPAGAVLQFSGVCRPQLDFGAGWVDGLVAPDQGRPERAVELSTSYKHPVPAGAASVQIRFADDGWYGPGFGCLAEGFAVTAVG